MLALRRCKVHVVEDLCEDPSCSLSVRGCIAPERIIAQALVVQAEQLDLLVTAVDHSSISPQQCATSCTAACMHHAHQGTPHATARMYRRRPSLAVVVVDLIWRLICMHIVIRAACFVPSAVCCMCVYCMIPLFAQFVGSHESLGNWDAASAPNCEWTEGKAHNTSACCTNPAFSSVPASRYVIELQRACA